MKKIFILSILFAMVSCSEQPNTNVYHEAKRTDDVYKVVLSTNSNTVDLHVVVIDSCEYLIGSGRESYAGYGYLSHKGNCKYCAERRKRELQNVNKSHKSNGKMKNQLK